MSISINVASIQPSTLIRDTNVTQENLSKAASSIVDAFEAAPKVALPGGQSLSLPQGLPSQDAQAVEALFSGLAPDALTNIESRTQTVIAETRASIRSGDESGLSTLSSGQAESSQAWLESIAPFAVNGDDKQSELTGWMIYAMGNVTNDLGSFAAEVDAKNKAASDVRTTLQEVRDVIEDDEWPQEITYTEYTVGEDGQVVVTEKTVTLGSAEEAQNLMEKLEGQLSTLKDFQQSDALELQQRLEEQQKIFNTLSAILENIHKTQQSMINNLRA